jgi:hypothetical protein
MLYFYLSELHPEEIFDEDLIDYAKRKVSEAEAEDYPYPDEELPENPIRNIKYPKEVFLLDDKSCGYDSRDLPSFYFIFLMPIRWRRRCVV